MAETFPIQCHSCAEILDVAADIDVAAPYDCPLCGAEIAIAEAEDFDLPCPAEVVVEEQSAERLSFRLRSSLPGSNRLVFYLLFSLLFPAQILFLGACIELARSWRSPIIFAVFLLPTLDGFVMIFLSSIFLFGKTCIELSDRQMIIGKGLWLFRIHQRRDVDAIADVTLRTERSDIWPFRDRVYYTHIRAKAWGRRFAESRSPDPGRYVTHLIRRQLKTMGHNLQDG